MRGTLTLGDSMAQFSMDAECYLFLKSYAAEQGVSMAAVLRTVIDAFKENPRPVISTADHRTKTWYVVIHVWEDGDYLRHTLHATIPNTAELPALAERACREAGAPSEGVAEHVRAQLAHFRQNLGRSPDAASLRVHHPEWMLQISVHRTPPDGFRDAPENLRPFRV